MGLEYFSPNKRGGLLAAPDIFLTKLEGGSILRKTGLLVSVLLVISCLGLNSCKSGQRQAGKLRIGFSMDSLLIERWQRDRDQFVAHAKELGAEVLVQSADGNDSTQVRQCENLLTQGIDVLVIVPHNAEVMASIV